MKPIYDLIEAINGLAAELRALRYADLNKVVGELKKPTDDVKEELKHQS